MNRNKFFLQTIFSTIITTVVGGSVLQTFMLEKNISEDSVGLYFSIMQVAQIFIMLFFSKGSDKIKNIIKVSAYIHLLNIPFIILLLSLCFFEFNNIFLLIVTLGFVANISIGIFNILTYKLPYHIMDMTDYGQWTGISSIFAGVVTFLFSVTLTFLQKWIGYMPTMKYIYVLSILVQLLLVSVIASYKRVKSNVNISNDSGKMSFLKYKPFTVLILPNILRGFCLGMVSMAVTIGYFTERLDSFSASILLIVTQVSTILGAFVYTYFAGKEKYLLLICSICIIITLPLMVSFNTVAFLIFYGVVYLFITIINISIPVIVVKIIDYDVAGQYNGGRMLLNTFGLFLASLLCGTMLKTIGPVMTLVISGAAQLISGIAYVLYMQKRRI